VCVCVQFDFVCGKRGFRANFNMLSGIGNFVGSLLMAFVAKIERCIHVHSLQCSSSYFRRTNLFIVIVEAAEIVPAQT
jgi:hypothetical protein